MKIQLLLSMALALFFTYTGIAQEDFPTGLVDNEEVAQAYNAMDRAPSPGSKSGELSLSKVFKIDLSPFAPPVGHQGRIGSCVGWSVGNALTISHAIQKNWNAAQTTDNAFSALYIYNQIKVADCSRGSKLDDAGRFLKKNGDFTRKVYDLNVNDCERIPTDGEQQKAKQFAIQDFMPIFQTDATVKEKIFATKVSLADSIPVVIGMRLRQNFKKIANGFWSPAEGDTRPMGAHAMCVVGFSESKKAFKILNSWGTRWGELGYVWVKYTDFADYCSYGYQYIIKEQAAPPEEEEKKVVSVKGQFDFRHFEFNDNDEPVPTPVAASYSEGYQYKLAKENWEFGDLYQFIIKNVPKKRYVYAFSLDANGLNIHYPRGIAFDEQSASFGSGESPIVRRMEDIFVPSEESALSREAKGEDHICILYSAKQIEDYKARLLKLRGLSGDFNTRLKEAFGDVMLNPDEIEYQKDAMSFKANSNGNRTAVPIIVTLMGD